MNSSITEGVSLTILEAMAAGLPVVATRVGGTPEIVEPSWGCLVPARDAAALGQAISELGDDVQMRARLGTEARRAAETRFQIDRMIAEYRAVYARVTARR